MNVNEVELTCKLAHERLVDILVDVNTTEDDLYEHDEHDEDDGTCYK